MKNNVLRSAYQCAQLDFSSQIRMEIRERKKEDIDGT